MAKSGLLIDNVTSGDAAGKSGQRGVLTAINYDLVGSTRLLDELDIEDYQELIADFQHEVSQAVVALAGRLQDVEGDGGMVTFPPDMDTKDAAALAIQAGFEIIAACRRVAARKRRADLQVRVGIATSKSLVQSAGQKGAAPKVTSAALALATRLQSLASPGTILVSQQTRAAARRSHVFERHGTLPLKGFSKPEEIWRAVGYRRKVDRYFAFGRLGATLVDRVQEQDELRANWQLAAEGKGRAILIEGEAGIGKSRLIHRIRAFMGGKGARRMMFQCYPGGARTTLHPLLRALPQAEGAGRSRGSAAAVSQLFREAGIHDQEVIDVFAFLLGAAEGGELRDASLDVVREKSGWAARRCLAELCSTGPLLLVVEDVHWIDPTSRHLLASALEVIADLPVLVLLTSRPLAGAPWQDLPNTRIMPLGPLGGQDARSVIIARFPRQGELQGAAMLDLIEKVSGGVPLYIEEICQWAAENLPSAREALAMSDSSNRLSAFETVVAARLARLGAAAEVAGAAAAVGIRFGTQLLKAVLPAVSAEVVDGAIAELLKQGFVVQVSLSEPALYAFRHALVRETVYKSLLRAERQGLHGRIYAIVHADRAAAPWIDAAALAEQAEGAGLLAEAVDCLLAAGGSAAARSAMAEARQLLEHALALCRSMEDEDRRERLMLRTTALLGPVLTTSEGPGSEPAQRLYEEGIAIARRRPPAERATWFPVYWGWWFTGSDVNGERAHALLEEMRDVDNAEVQLQSRHCVWAIDFYLGRHGVCVTSVDEALPLYELHPELRNPTHYGGHDTKVCGLAHRGLAQWFKGRAADAIVSLQEAKVWAAQTGHPGSIAHAGINCAMLAAYRRDFPQLRKEIAELRLLTTRNRMPTLEATAEILEGWCTGVEGDAAVGRDLMRQGLDVHRKLQTPEDYPVYCTLLAEVLARTGETAEALRLLDAIADEQGASGHVFWLAELHRRRAQLMALEGAASRDVEKLLAASLEIAVAQGAVPLLLKSYETLLAFAPHSELAGQFRAQADAARLMTDDAVPLFAVAEVIAFPDRKA